VPETGVHGGETVRHADDGDERTDTEHDADLTRHGDDR